jgi:hypothetical protein
VARRAAHRQTELGVVEKSQAVTVGTQSIVAEDQVLRRPRHSDAVHVEFDKAGVLHKVAEHEPGTSGLSHRQSVATVIVMN